jgi:hypothetical protein
VRRNGWTSKHRRVTSDGGPDRARVQFEAKASCIQGRRLLSVDYWDILEPAEAEWDYGDWHHAVMGVQLGTDQGPVTVMWTAAFFPYGVEAFLGPIHEHFVAEGGPHRVGPDINVGSPWAQRIGSLISRTALHWTHVEVGPATRSDGRVVGPAYTVEVPTVLRLDFAAGPVWFVAAMPQGPDMRDVFVMGDEIMVVFSAEKVRSLGFSDLRLIP